MNIEILITKSKVLVSSRKRRAGFSLLAIAITISLISILVALATHEWNLHETERRVIRQLQEKHADLKFSFSTSLDVDPGFIPFIRYAFRKSIGIRTIHKISMVVDKNHPVPGELLERFHSLRSMRLDIRSRQVDLSGLTKIKRLRQLQLTDIYPDDLEPLSKISSLELLVIRLYGGLDDAWPIEEYLSRFAVAKNLKWIYSPVVDDELVANLHKELPNCKVFRISEPMDNFVDKYPSISLDKALRYPEDLRFQGKKSHRSIPANR